MHELKEKNSKRLPREIAEIFFSLYNWVTLNYDETTVDFFVRREEVKMVKCGLKFLDNIKNLKEQKKKKNNYQTRKT